jgi:Putative lumazine-binding
MNDGAMRGEPAVDDVEAVRATITTYLDWVRTGDEDLWPLAFHPRATVVNATRGDDNVTGTRFRKRLPGRRGVGRQDLLCAPIGGQTPSAALLCGN